MDASENFKVKQCMHCQSPTDADFCCVGCSAAYDIIGNLDLTDYYKYCKDIYNSAPNTIVVSDLNIDYSQYAKACCVPNNQFIPNSNVNNIGSTNTTHNISREKSHEDSELLQTPKFCNQDEQSFTITLLVEGMVCGSCLWLIESTIQKQGAEARVNLSTKQITIVYKKDITFINEIIAIVTQLGFKFSPYEKDAFSLSKAVNETRLLKRIAVSGIAATNTMALSFAGWYMQWNDISPETGQSITLVLLQIFAAALSIPASIYSAKEMFQNALKAALKMRYHMDIPIIIAVVFSIVISLSELYAQTSTTFFEAGITLLFAINISRFLEERVKNNANSQVMDMYIKQPRSVRKITNDHIINHQISNETVITDVKNTQIGEYIQIIAGDRIALDCTLEFGNGLVDTSMIDGESSPKKIQEKSAELLAGSVLLEGSIIAKVIRNSKNSFISKMIQLIEKSQQNSNSKYVAMSQTVLSYYVPFVLLMALITAIAWWPDNNAILYAVSLMIITCPCALGLAVPIAQVAACNKLMKLGALVRNPNFLEKAMDIKNVMLDKTGTLTTAELHWKNIDDFEQDEYRLIYSLSLHSNHPIACSVRNALNSCTPIKLDSVIQKRGKGILGTYKGYTICLGSAEFCKQNGFTENQKDDFDGYYMCWYASSMNSDNAGCIKPMLFKEDLRNGISEAINYMSKNMGCNVFIASGDRLSEVQKIASKIGLANEGQYFAQQLPQDKQKLALSKSYILMIGDGLNDAAAMKSSYISISFAGQNNIANNMADVVVTNKSFDVITNVLITSRKTIAIMKQNLALSLAYNAITIPVAMMGFASPVAAAVAMSTSSLLVVLNSLRILR